MTASVLMTLCLLVPLAGAGLVVMSRAQPNQREGATLASALALFVCVAALVPGVLAGGRPRVVLAEPVAGLPLVLELEPLGMLFALVAATLWIVNSIYSIGYMRANGEHRQTRFYACFAIAIASAVGIAFAGNLLTLFVFYEALTLSTYPLVAHKGDANARRGARVYLSLLLATSIGFQLVAIGWTWVAAGTLDFRAGGILAGHIEGWPVAVLLLLFMYGVGKAALMPLHRWLPAAMVAPTPVSALLHAVAVVKAGVFTVVKIIVYVFGTGFLAQQPGSDWLLAIACFTVLAASVIALRQDNLKRRLAYSTVSQLSYVVMAAALLTPLSIAGAAMHIAAHAFGKITLFFAAGAIYTVAHKTEVSELDGIGRRMPITMLAFAIGSLSMIGVPPTVGFISKWTILQGSLEAGQMLVVGVIIASTLLNAAYFLPIVYAAFFRAPEVAMSPADAGGAGHGHDAGSTAAGAPSQARGEAPLPILIALVITAAATLLLFFFPSLPLQLARDLAGVVSP